MFRILVATMVGAVSAQDCAICPVINCIGQCQALGGCIIPVPSVFRVLLVGSCSTSVRGLTNVTGRVRNRKGEICGKFC